LVGFWEDQCGRGTWHDSSIVAPALIVQLFVGHYTSDSTIGQLLRYIAYVKENIAKPGQSVKGLIVAKEIDDALRYAIKPVPSIKVLTYRVDFKLHPTN
jgi:hypothetical protein